MRHERPVDEHALLGPNTPAMGDRLTRQQTVSRTDSPRPCLQWRMDSPPANTSEDRRRRGRRPPAMIDDGPGLSP